MRYEAKDPEDYIRQIPEDRQEAVRKLMKTVKENLPEGFQETMSYGMIAYVVPHSIYLPGYHVNPNEPLGFISIASQKHFIAFYHMGLYMDPVILKWFADEYPKYSKTKLDMGKGCVRFKNVNNIPYELIAQLCGKIRLEEYVNRYKESLLTHTK